MLKNIQDAETWLNTLNIDPIKLREQCGMKGKKHLVELLVGYRSIIEFYRGLPDGANEVERVRKHVANVLEVLNLRAYHDLGHADNRRFAEDVLSYLFACDLARLFGFDEEFYLSEIRKILPRIYEYISICGAHQKMACIRRLRALNLPATDTMENLIGQTRIRQRKPLSQILKADVYVIVHEIIHLTDMGRHPPHLLGAEDKAYLSGLFRELLYPRSFEDLDFLAEVAEAMLYLGGSETDAWVNALDWIALHQNENGSFGSFEAARENLQQQGSAYNVDVGMYLHTTTVCLKALVASVVNRQTAQTNQA